MNQLGNEVLTVIWEQQGEMMSVFVPHAEGQINVASITMTAYVDEDARVAFDQAAVKALDAIMGSPGKTHYRMMRRFPL